MWTYVLNFHESLSRSTIAELYNDSVLNSLRNYQIIFQSGYHFIIPETVNEDSVFCTSLPTSVTVCHFDFSYPNGCEMVILLWFWLLHVSQKTKDFRFIFMCLLPICLSSQDKRLFDLFPVLQLKCLSSSC